MANFWNTTVACKYSVATTCKTSALHDELPRQLKTWNSLKVDQIEKILKQSLPPDSKEVVELVQEAIKLMTYHETTTVDLCADDIECQECLEATVNLLYSSPNVTACKNPIEWQNLKYNPKLNNRKNRMRTEYNNLISINANKIKCNNIVPGISRMSRGVDITTLDLYPADIKKKDGFRSVLFDLSCSHNHLWTHPTIDNYQYSLPDQIAGINTLSTGSRTVKMSCHQNLQEFKESLGHSVSLGISLGGWGSFSASYSYNEAKEQIIKSDKSISEASTHISTLQVDFHSSEEMQPSQSFLNYIYKKLPDKYEDNPDIYHEFVHKFGTHYFESANFGGLIYQKTVIQNSYLYKTDEKDLSMNLQANFLASAPRSIGLDFDAKYATKSSSLDEQFKSNTDTSESYYGGKPDLANHEDSSYLSRWMETVYKDPWLFSGKLVPIESLISDQTIQGEVKKAISVYRTKAFLKDFRETLSMGKFNVSLETMTYLAKIESYLDNPTLTQYNGTFDKIGNDIDDLFGQVQEMRDRALLQEYYDKMVALWNSIFKCKYGIAKMCKSSPLHEEMIRQRNAWFYIMDDKIGKALRRNTRPKSKDISDLIRQATKLLHYHETTVVDLCQGKKECQSCLEWNADCWYSEERNATALSCDTEAAWKIIQYHPKKRLIIYGESDRYCN